MADDKEELPGFWKKVVSHLKGLATAAAALTGALAAVWGVWSWVKDHLPQSSPTSPIQTASAPTVAPPSPAPAPVPASISAAPSAASPTLAAPVVRKETPAGDAEQKAALAASRAAEATRKKQELARKKAAADAQAREEERVASEAEAARAAAKAASDAEAQKLAKTRSEPSKAAKLGMPESHAFDSMPENPQAMGIDLFYYLEFGVYPNRNEAQGVVNALAATNVNAFIVNRIYPTSRGNQSWWHVWAGPYSTRSAMASSRQHFKELGLDSKETYSRGPSSSNKSAGK